MASPSSLHSISLSLLFLIFLSGSHSLNVSHSSHLPLNLITDVHDLLPLYGLPKGLLPGNVKSYSLDKETGSFSIELTSDCYVHFEQLVWYDKKIVGKLTYGAVKDVSGIQAKKLFLWLPVTGMEKVSGSDTIKFYVGSLSEELPAGQFAEIPDCKRKACPRSSISSM